MDKDRSSIPVRYYFVIQRPDRDDDDKEGTLLPDKTAALAYARRIISELKEAGGYEGPGLTMIVRNTDGEVIYSIPF